MASSGCPHESLLERICFSSRWSFATQIDYNCLESQSSRGRVAQLGEHLLCKRETKFARTCRSRPKTAKKQQLVANPSKPFFSFLFALPSQFTRICRNFHYVFITVQPEKARWLALARAFLTAWRRFGRTRPNPQLSGLRNLRIATDDANEALLPKKIEVGVGGAHTEIDDCGKIA